MRLTRYFRYWTYFKRGHAQWINFALAIINFTLIFYNLLFMQLEFIPTIYKNYLLFFVVFIACYIPFTTIVGWVDVKRLRVLSVEQTIGMEANPLMMEMLAILKRLDE